MLATPDGSFEVADRVACFGLVVQSPGEVSQMRVGSAPALVIDGPVVSGGWVVVGGGGGAVVVDGGGGGGVVAAWRRVGVGVGAVVGDGTTGAVEVSGRAIVVAVSGTVVVLVAVVVVTPGSGSTTVEVAPIVSSPAGSHPPVGRPSMAESGMIDALGHPDPAVEVGRVAHLEPGTVAGDRGRHDAVAPAQRADLVVARARKRGDVDGPIVDDEAARTAVIAGRCDPAESETGGRADGRDDAQSGPARSHDRAPETAGRGDVCGDSLEDRVGDAIDIGRRVGSVGKCLAQSFRIHDHRPLRRERSRRRRRRSADRGWSAHGGARS